MRGAPKRVARAQQTLTWAALKGQLGTALPDMTDRERQRLIALVDAASERDELLLSSVLAAADPQLAEAYRLSVNRLGGHLPADDRELLREVIDADVRQTHAYWRPGERSSCSPPVLVEVGSSASAWMACCPVLGSDLL